MITANRAWSTRRRRSSRAGKNEPVRSFGIRNRRSPLAWTTCGGGNRCAGLVRDGVCSQGWAPIVADQLRLDQGLVHRLGRDPDAFTGLASLEYVENLE
jgi:hypothetical protein